MATRIMVRNIEDALEIYYSYQEIGTTEIIRLFGCGRSTATRLKKLAREEQERQGIITFSDLNVNTKCAFTAWCIDVSDLEKRVVKLRKFRSSQPEPIGA